MRFFYLIPLSIVLIACTPSPPDPSSLPTVITPQGEKINLDQVSLTISHPQILHSSENNYTLEFDYTITNHAQTNIAFLCLYNNTDDLIQVNLTDNQGKPITLNKRLLEGLTLTEPRLLHILVGKTTRHLSIPFSSIKPRKKGEPLSMRVRLHAPSRYDELRSTIEAPIITLLW